MPSNFLRRICNLELTGAEIHGDLVSGTSCISSPAVRLTVVPIKHTHGSESEERVRSAQSGVPLVAFLEAVSFLEAAVRFGWFALGFSFSCGDGHRLCRC